MIENVAFAIETKSYPLAAFLVNVKFYSFYFGIPPMCAGTKDFNSNICNEYCLNL